MFRNLEHQQQQQNQQQSYPPQQQQRSNNLYYNTQQQNARPFTEQQQHQQPQQQQLSQAQQQQQQQQQQQGSVSGGTVDGGSGSNGGNGPQEMNLASVLHYLQSEWRRWERDRNEWEIERAEMRARIALLEGQRRSAENLKVDLLRRVKMLEFALRQERTKTVSSGQVSSIPPSKLAALQDEDRTFAGGKDENKEGSGSEGSQEDFAERSSAPPKMNGIHPAAISKATNTSILPFRSSTLDSNASSAWKSIGSAPRDPKSRARSREYLKQCLQEISYLTSPGALNPLPPRPPIDSNYPITEEQQSNVPDTQAEPADRPTKTLPEQTIPSMYAQTLESQPSQTDQTPSEPGRALAQNETQKQLPNGSSSSHEQPKPATEPPPAGLSASVRSSEMSLDPTAKPPSSPAPRTLNLPTDTSTSTSTSGEPPRPSLNTDLPPEAEHTDDHGKQILTAIYRPDSKTAWREELRNANEMAEKAKEDRKAPSSSSSSSTDEEQLSSLTLNVDDDDAASKTEEVAANGLVEEKVWTTRRSLKSHLDIVRAIAFAHGPGVVLATGGDDCTVKIWGVDEGSVMNQKPSAHEIEPLVTYRGHTAPITSIAISTALSSIFSASLDSTIRVWKLPSIHHDPYSNYDASSSLQTLEGHTDSIWDLVLLPSREVNGKKVEEKLVSASSDGTIKIWTTSSTPSTSTNKERRQSHGSASGQGVTWKLKSSYSNFFNNNNNNNTKTESGGESPTQTQTQTQIQEIPTCLEICNSDYGNVYIGTNKGRVLLLDTDKDEGNILQIFGENSDDENAQINAILSHPTLPAIATGGEDGYIRFYDIKSASPSPTHSILAHPSSITSLSISPLSPTCILSSSNDCSVRLWDLSKKTCLQDLSGHRPRSGEGVERVAAHPELPILGTVGADGVVRLWGAS
ncbi:uncharacterized protein I303_104223 [Kwoniella dejecticola CBS 10117]|uniref:Striatin N-terminal domain-containing protein n=1 Tax=Kwoniella dejecticola CBS 10117 TaxID=1296121 RepID=A0A1A6A5Y7_9TREE|nr:uncharacterized protein I303_04800 [Kwoniella dejecticola CBS 10117]OBR85464.1 hypothetical protein I303_04800 [Kwoniella dejecticola CBS 10117]